MLTNIEVEVALNGYIIRGWGEGPDDYSKYVEGTAESQVVDGEYRQDYFHW